MTEARSCAASGTSPEAAQLGRLVAVLAVTQTVGYGVLHYTLPVLLAPVAADLGVPVAAVAGGATVSVIASGLVAVPVGRWLDRHGGRALMTAGSLLGVLGIAAWSQVTEMWHLWAAFAVLGIALAASSYEAAFAVLVAVAPRARRDRAMLAVTVVAGFASSIFFPVTSVLTAHLGWRDALLLLAGLLALTAVPGHLLAVPARRAHRAGAKPWRLPPAVRDVGFWLLTGAFFAHSAAVAAMGMLLITHLAGAGWPVTVAAGTAGLLGVLSVTGRILLTGLSRRWGMATVTAAVFLVQAAGVALLPYAQHLAAVVACVVAFGVGFGVATIARPAILADRYGTAGYATSAAVMILPLTLARAGAPLAAAALGDPAFLGWTAAACLAAAALLVSTRWLPAMRAPHATPSERAR